MSIASCQVGYLDVLVDNGFGVKKVKTKKAWGSIIVYKEGNKNKVTMVVPIRNEPRREWAVEGMGGLILKRRRKQKIPAGADPL